MWLTTAWPTTLTTSSKYPTSSINISTSTRILEPKRPSFYCQATFSYWPISEKTNSFSNIWRPKLNHFLKTSSRTYIYMQWSNWKHWNRRSYHWSSREVGDRPTFRWVLHGKNQRCNYSDLQQNRIGNGRRRKTLKIFEVQKDLFDGANGCKKICSDCPFVWYLCEHEWHKSEVKQFPASLQQDRFLEYQLRVYQKGQGVAESCWVVPR